MILVQLVIYYCCNVVSKNYVTEDFQICFGTFIFLCFVFFFPNLDSINICSYDKYPNVILHLHLHNLFAKSYKDI